MKPMCFAATQTQTCWRAPGIEPGIYFVDLTFFSVEQQISTQ